MLRPRASEIKNQFLISNSPWKLAAVFFEAIASSLMSFRAISQQVLSCKALRAGLLPQERCETCLPL